jgi:hypothetical protein
MLNVAGETNQQKCVMLTDAELLTQVVSGLLGWAVGSTAGVPWDWLRWAAGLGIRGYCAGMLS